MKSLLTTAKVKTMVGLLCLFILLMLAASASANVVISEMMYHPPQILDEQYEFLELYNTGTSTVNLQNWVIDGIGFTFPAGATIGPGAYLVLAKDPNQVQAAYGFLPSYAYTGKLSNSGESIKLIDANGIIVDEVAYTTYPPWPVTTDELGPSLERIDPTLNGNTPRNWHASIAPAGHTGGALNSVNAVGLPPWISNVQNSTVQQDTPITVTASVVDATIVNLKYLINFGTPVVIAMQDDGLSGDGAAGDGLYGATIPAQPMNTVIRYRVDTTGATGVMGFPRDDDSVVYTGTYIEDDASVITGLPIVHWLIDPCDFTNAVASSTLSNYKDYIYPALVYYNGTLCDVNIYARGNTSRSWPKKNWKFKTARNHDFFMPGTTGIPVDNFNFQASYSDKSYTRENVSWRLFEDVGEPYCQFAPVRMYQNGQFFGLYSYFEALDKSFLERNGLDADTGATYKADQGSMADCRYLPLAELPNYYEKHRPAPDGDFNDLHDLLNGLNNLTGQAWRNFILDNLDIPRIMNYLAAMVVLHDNDAMGKNYYLYRDNAGTKRWYILPWDKDLTFGRNYNEKGVLNDDIWANVDSYYTSVHPEWGTSAPSHPLFGNQAHPKVDALWNRLIELLYNQTDFRNMFYRRLRTIMDEQLQASGTPYAQRKIEKRIDELIALEDTEAAMDFAKWGSWGQIQTPTQAAQILKDSYLAVRRTHLFVTHRVAGEIPEAQTSVSTIVINEIMYNPAGGDNDEFIELYNPSSTESVDMSGWQLDGVELTFPPGTVLLPQSYLVVAKNDVQFRATYGSGIFIAAQYGGSLDNTGENLVLKDRQGNVIDEVGYDDGGFWPIITGGQSLELIDASRNNNYSMNWEASVSPGGTPGAINSMAGTFPYIPELKVNEVLSVNTSINTDEMGEYAPWIEIYNDSPGDVDLGGMFLTNDHNNPAKWVIPAGTILNSGQWMIFWADAEPNEGPLHTNFALNAAGGAVGLYTADGYIIDYLDYGALAANISYGKYPDGIAMYREFATPTPTAENYIAPVPLILNEYTGVADTKYIKDNASDTYWGRVLGNGGDWFELVVTQDHLDARGWNLIVSDNGISKTLTLTSNNLWADLRAGTIITVSENLPDNISNYDPPNGKWWINVQAKTGASGTYITAANFDVSQTNSQITIRDSNGTRVFGPSGEGIKPASGIGNDEIFHLEEDPGALITERSNYTDGSASTFGAPNIYTSGKVQDFSKLRVIPDTGAPTPDQMTWEVEPTATGTTSITMIATAASDSSGVEYYFECTSGSGHSSGWQNSTYYKDKNLQPGTTYTYRVKARDMSPNQNETAWSSSVSDTTATESLPTNVAIVGSWLTGTTHAKETGTNRALVFIAHAEHTASTTLNSVTYGGRTMTKVVERIISSGTTRTYVAAFILNDANITAATTTTFTPVWSATPTSSAYSSVFFQNVNQSTLTGATANNATSSGATITTSALANNSGDMIIDAATCSNTGSYTVNNSFTEALELTITNADGVDGYKSATGASQTPSVTHSTSTGRQSLIGFVVKAASLPAPPGQISTPNPVNWMSNVSLSAGLSWIAGSGATSHDVYFGTSSPPTFRGNQTGTTFAPGTLSYGTTYYWRIDEKNAYGTTTGATFSFATVPTPPTQAANPSPAHSATNVSIDAHLSWTAGSRATSHDVYFGTSSSGTLRGTQTGTTFDPGTLTKGVTYYWRIDEKNAGGTTTGTVWSFTTVLPPPPAQAVNPNPANSAANVSLTNDLSWTAGSGATSHDVYFGTSNPPTLRGNQTGTTFDTGTMTSNTTYCWRIDEKNLGGTTTGTVWSFTTVPPPPPAVSILGSWVTGLTHTKETGTNRALIFIAHSEDNDDPSISLSSVSYGGQAMTKILERASGTTSNSRTYVAVFRLSETGVAAATATTFSVTWNQTPDDKNYESVFLQNVNQTTPIGATANNGVTTGATITTSSLATSSGDFVIDAATCSNTGSYTTNNSFTEALEVTFPLNSSDGVVGYKSATGASETPSVTHSTTTGRQSLVGFVVKVASGSSTPPAQASNPSPANSARIVSTTADLSWTAGSGAASHNVYFGTTNPPTFIGNQTGTTFDTGTMNAGTTYYWRIDEKNAGGTTTGTVWSFTTNALVPNVVSMTQAAATTAITGAGLVVGTITQAYSNTVAAGLVISQTPVGGTVVDTGSAVNLVISLGRPVVPNVVGMTQAAAATAITAVDNLTVGTVTQAYSNTVAAGLVISQTPVGGTVVDTGSAVNLVISLGRPVVPNVVGMTQAAATTAITAVDNLTVGTVTQAYSDTVAAGLVISQTPVGGTEVNIGSSVDLVISLGKPVVPNVVGMTQAAATTAITAVDNLTVGTVTQAYSNTVAAGLVISQTPIGGTVVDTGSAVNLVISLGRPVVPNVVGMTQAAAATAITAVDNLTVGTVTQAYSNTVAAGLVISQTPVGGTVVDTGSAVNLVISLGRPVVPNVVGMTQAAATTAITAVDNLTVGTVTQAYSNTVAVGLVISQTPVGGTEVNIGSSVDLVISLGKPVVPNVVGMTQAAAAAAITAVDNLTVGTVTQQYSDTVAAGLVISQTPVGGTQVNIGSSVDLVISLGLPIIPDVTNTAQAAAEAAIVAAAFTVGNVTTAYSDTVAAGNVISQSLVGPAVSGTAVDLVVSLGLPIIPDVTNTAQAAAEAAIVAATFTVGNVTTAYSDTVAAGNVISQSLVGPATSGTAVDMVVSLGLPIIPDVTGQAQAAAEAAIVAAAFTVGNVTTAYSDTVAAGNVISQSLVGPAVSGTAVDLVVSLGLPIIPDVTNTAQAAAEAAIVAATFTVGNVTTAYSDTVAAGNVISQSPIGGTAAVSGTAVDMVVSLGLPIIPDVTGQAQAAAEAAIVAAAFTVGNVTTAYSETVAAGLVISQNPAGGTEANIGSAVDLIVSSGQ